MVFIIKVKYKNLGNVMESLISANLKRNILCYSVLESLRETSYKFRIKNEGGWARWLMPIIPVFWEAKMDGSLEVRSSRPAWSTW